MEVIEEEVGAVVDLVGVGAEEEDLEVEEEALWTRDPRTL